MSDRQYIGARYVPLFFEGAGGSNDWVQGIAYEPLTVVTYLNTVYTSKKQVPANIGSPNLNPEYWVATGNYNAQVEEYRQEVAELSEDVEEYKDTVESIGVTPEMFGAKGDGITDDTLAFQTAVNSGKTVYLVGNYKIGKITGDNINIVGNGKRIYNKDKDVLFNITNTATLSNLTIENVAEFDYLSTIANYGCIKARNVFAKNLTMININSAGIYVDSGNCILDGCYFDNHNFDVKSLYDGSANNHNDGVFIRQGANTVYCVIENCKFEYLIEGIYFGSYGDATYTELQINNNYFGYCGDHGCYINSYEDRCVDFMANNVFYKCTVGICVCGNNHYITNNLCQGVFDGNRVCFGFAIRDGGNVLFKHNKLDSGTFTSSAGIGAGSLIMSLLNATRRSDIIIEENEFFYNDTGTYTDFLRIGGGLNAPIDNVVIKNNRMVVNGGEYAIRVGSGDINLYLIDNYIEFNQHFLNTVLCYTVCKGNTIKNRTTNGCFSLVSNGEYYDNIFDTNVMPLRKASETTFIVGRNRMLNSAIGIYNIIDLTGDIEWHDVVTGEIVANSTTFILTDLVNIRPAFNQLMIVYDANGNAVDATVTNYAVGAITLTLPSTGVFKYKLM